MERLLILSALYLTGVSAMADLDCPDLSGSFKCDYKNGVTQSFDISQSKVNGITTFYFLSAGDSRFLHDALICKKEPSTFTVDEVADGKVRPSNTWSDDHAVRAHRETAYSCFASSLIEEMMIQGFTYGQPGPVTFFHGTVTLDSKGNLIANGKDVTNGQEDGSWAYVCYRK